MPDREPNDVGEHGVHHVKLRILGTYSLKMVAIGPRLLLHRHSP